MLPLRLEFNMRQCGRSQIGKITDCICYLWLYCFWGLSQCIDYQEWVKDEIR